MNPKASRISTATMRGTKPALRAGTGAEIVGAVDVHTMDAEAEVAAAAGEDTAGMAVTEAEDTESDCRREASGLRIRASGFGLHAPGFGLRARSHGLNSSPFTVPGHNQGGRPHAFQVRTNKGRIISLSSCSTMWQCHTKRPGTSNLIFTRVTCPG